MMENNKFDDTSPFGAGVLLNNTKSSDPAFLMARCYNFIINNKAMIPALPSQCGVKLY